MAADPQSPDYAIAVIGTGTMGRGIAQIAAAGGIRVMMFDARKGAAEAARTFITRMIDRAAEKGSISRDDAAAAIARTDIVETMAELAPAHLVVLDRLQGANQFERHAVDFEFDIVPRVV